MILVQAFKHIHIEVNVNDVRIRITGLDILYESLQQFGLSAAPDAGNDLDVRGAHDVFQLVQIKVALNQPHGLSPRSYSSMAYFAK